MNHFLSVFLCVCVCTHTQQITLTAKIIHIITYFFPFVLYIQNNLKNVSCSTKKVSDKPKTIPDHPSAPCDTCLAIVLGKRSTLCFFFLTIRHISTHLNWDETTKIPLFYLVWGQGADSSAKPLTNPALLIPTISYTRTFLCLLCSSSLLSQRKKHYFFFFLKPDN